MTEAEKTRLKDGLSAAIDRLEDGSATAVLVIELHADRRGVRFWEGGEAQPLLDAMLRSIPLSRRIEP